MYRPEHGNDEKEIVKLVGAMAPNAEHCIRYENEVHKGNDLQERERERGEREGVLVRLFNKRLK